MFPLALSLFLFALTSRAAPAPLARQTTGVTGLSASELAAFAPYTHFAGAAYCPQGINDWQCGGPCNAILGFEPTLSGGNGDSIQYYFVGYWPTQHSIIVSHQGTDPTKILSLLTDINFLGGILNTTLFPGVSTDVRVHDGFRDQHALTADTILAEVKSLMASRKTSSVTIVGHSLGGALAELESLYLTLHLPAGSNIQAITYGTPRVHFPLVAVAVAIHVMQFKGVGNAAFAALIDSQVPSFRRINNKKDMVPILPPRSIGFLHPRGEVHILSPGDAIACPGDDDASDSACQDLTVPTILQGNLADHLGPYENISLGPMFCK